MPDSAEGEAVDEHPIEKWNAESIVQDKDSSSNTGGKLWI